MPSDGRGDAPPGITVTCRCGAVALELDGPPVLSAACHCDDCQAGGRQLEALPGAPRVLGEGAGTPYLLFRRDRARVLRGADRLQAHTLRPNSGTRRIAASCCNTPLYVDARAAPWIDVYRDRVEDAPPLAARVMTRFAAPGSLPDDGVPRHRRVSPLLAARVLAAALPALAHPRRLRWPPAG